MHVSVELMNLKSLLIVKGQMIELLQLYTGTYFSLLKKDTSPSSKDEQLPMETLNSLLFLCLEKSNTKLNVIFFSNKNLFLDFKLLNLSSTFLLSLSDRIFTQVSLRSFVWNLNYNTHK